MFTEIVKDEVYRGYRVLVKKIEHNLPLAIPFDYWYCGYVEIPKESRFYDVDDFDKLDYELEVHGGITFASKLFETGNFALGFDCNHMDDSPEKQDEKFTLKECHNLVDQIIDIEDEEIFSEERIRFKCIKNKEDEERMDQLPFWQKIIEDLTGLKMMLLIYNPKSETLETLWRDMNRESIIINICGESLKECTHDVVRQTYKWIERN